MRPKPKYRKYRLVPGHRKENGRRKMRTNEMVDRYIENEEEKKPFNFFKTQRRVGKNGYGMPESY